MIQTRIDLTPAEWRRVKALAAERGMSVAVFLAYALATARATKAAFADGN